MRLWAELSLMLYRYRAAVFFKQKCGTGSFKAILEENFSLIYIIPSSPYTSQRATGIH